MAAPRKYKTVTEAADALMHAKAKVRGELATNSTEYQRLTAEADHQKQVWDDANRAGNLQNRLAASAARNTALAAITKLETQAFAASTDVTTAQSDLSFAQQQDQQQSRQQSQTTSTPSSTISGSDAGTSGSPSGSSSSSSSYSSSSSDKSVHVNGYTRKDGTYVQSHSRSAPGHGGGHR